jgi:hypothetical protein
MRGTNTNTEDLPIVNTNTIQELKDKFLAWAEGQQDRCADADHYPDIVGDVEEIFNDLTKEVYFGRRER